MTSASSLTGTRGRLEKVDYTVVALILKGDPGPAIDHPLLAQVDWIESTTTENLQSWIDQVKPSTIFLKKIDYEEIRNLNLGPNISYLVIDEANLAPTHPSGPLNLAVDDVRLYNCAIDLKHVHFAQTSHLMLGPHVRLLLNASHFGDDEHMHTIWCDDVRAIDRPHEWWDLNLRRRTTHPHDYSLAFISESKRCRQVSTEIALCEPRAWGADSNYPYAGNVDSMANKALKGPFRVVDEDGTPLFPPPEGFDSSVPGSMDIALTKLPSWNPDLAPHGDALIKAIRELLALRYPDIPPHVTIEPRPNHVLRASGMLWHAHTVVLLITFFAAQLDYLRDTVAQVIDRHPASATTALRRLFASWQGAVPEGADPVPLDDLGDKLGTATIALSSDDIIALAPRFEEAEMAPSYALEQELLSRDDFADIVMDPSAETFYAEGSVASMRALREALLDLLNAPS